MKSNFRNRPYKSLALGLTILFTTSCGTEIAPGTDAADIYMGEALRENPSTRVAERSAQSSLGREYMRQINTQAARLESPIPCPLQNIEVDRGLLYLSYRAVAQELARLLGQDAHLLGELKALVTQKFVRSVEEGRIDDVQPGTAFISIYEMGLLATAADKGLFTALSEATRDADRALIDDFLNIGVTGFHIGHTRGFDRANAENLSVVVVPIDIEDREIKQYEFFDLQGAKHVLEVERAGRGPSVENRFYIYVTHEDRLASTVCKNIEPMSPSEEDRGGNRNEKHGGIHSMKIRDPGALDAWPADPDIRLGTATSSEIDLGEVGAKWGSSCSTLKETPGWKKSVCIGHATCSSADAYCHACTIKIWEDDWPSANDVIVDQAEVYSMTPYGANINIVVNGGVGFCCGSKKRVRGDWCEIDGSDNSGCTANGTEGYSSSTANSYSCVESSGGDPDPYCGDLICNGSESCSHCPGDCGSCGGGSSGGGWSGSNGCASSPLGADGQSAPFAGLFFLSFLVYRGRRKKYRTSIG